MTQDNEKSAVLRNVDSISIKNNWTDSRLGGMKIAQLCQESGLNGSTIHYYMRRGILHKPIKLGHGTFVYDETHLNRLRQIRMMRRQQSLSLSNRLSLQC